MTIAARDLDRVCVVEVEDDGAGEDPARIAALLAGEQPDDDGAAPGTRTEGTHPSVGLGNVDARLRSTYGDEAGLVVETAPGAGTRVVVRIPKFAPGVHV